MHYASILSSNCIILELLFRNVKDKYWSILMLTRDKKFINFPSYLFLVYNIWYLLLKKSYIQFNEFQKKKHYFKLLESTNWVMLSTALWNCINVLFILKRSYEVLLSVLSWLWFSDTATFIFLVISVLENSSLALMF